MRILGITRVARVTGLDRTGVEVACAVRPLGHVLQVTNGKGATFAQARASAVGEAAELWAAERVDALALVHASRAELVARYGKQSVWDAAALGSAGALCAPALWSQRTRVAWRWAERLGGGAPVLVPAQAVHCPPADGPPLGPAVVRWSTNGMGAHPRRAAALEHALLEVLERHQVARALPEGFTHQAMARRLLRPLSLPGSLRHLASQLSERGFDVGLLALGNAPPCAAALLVDRERGPIPVTAGYACRRSPEEALIAALLEAAQSRLTDIHGAREDVRPAAPREMRALARMLARTTPRRSATGWRPYSGRLERLVPEAAVVELAPPRLGLHVVKVIAPRLAVSELL
jgi:ribosomal protein S12 methylthiotransferase accessory factor